MGRARQRKRAQREQWEQLRGKEPGLSPDTIIVDEVSDMDPKVWNDLMTSTMSRGPAQPAPWTYSAGAGGGTGTLSPAATWRRAMLGDWGDAIAGGSFNGDPIGNTIRNTTGSFKGAAADVRINGDPIGKLSDVTMTIGNKTYSFKGAAAELEELERPASWGSW
jgi:hypothetical protein